MGMVVGGLSGGGGGGGDLEKNPPMMKYSVTRRKSNSNITAHSQRPAVPLSAFLFPSSLHLPAALSPVSSSVSLLVSSVFFMNNLPPY